MAQLLYKVLGLLWDASILNSPHIYWSKLARFAEHDYYYDHLTPLV